jgi:hypothetical protein
MVVETADVGLVRVGAGAVALTHRPKLKALPALRAAGATHLVTLLSRREGAPALGSAAQAAGLGWIWVELAAPGLGGGAGGSRPGIQLTWRRNSRLCAEAGPAGGPAA